VLQLIGRNEASRTCQTKISYLKGEDKTGSVINFRRIGEKYEVGFNNGKAFTYNAINVRIVDSALNAEKPRNCFEYLKRIAEAVGLTAEVEPGRVINILVSDYAKIDFVSPDNMLERF
jgi:hypothetical protein